jgi:small-conductance mechanosensitive channel/CRP-like cAMP-binding protein
MAVWKTVESTSGIPGAFPWVVAAFITAALVLYYFVPRERAHIRTAVALFGLSFAGLLVATEMHSLGATGLPYLCVNRLAMFLGGMAAVNLAAVVLFAVTLRPARLEPPPIAQDLLLALAYIVVAILVLSRSGVDVRGIVATSAVITAVIGFSLQDTLGNIMGGLALQMESTIRVGDWIRIDDIEGKVKQIRWRQTSIETRNWDTVVIPNSVLMKVKVTVLGRRAGAPLQRRQWVYFRVDLSHSPTKVIHTVETALHAVVNRHIATEPKPQCLVTDFKEGDAVYAVRYWLTDLSQSDPTDSLVRTRIYAALRRAGITLSLPMQAIRLTQENESAQELRELEELQRRIDVLCKLEFFEALTEEERAELAPRLITAHFVRGEAVTRQGAQAHWLYIIAEGDAEVEVAVDGKTQKVATLHSGNLFGEMGLMTGEPRTATVTTLSEVTCYLLGKEAFEDMLRRRPEIAEQISLTLARRRVELDAVREQLGQEAQSERMRAMQGALLRGIREFFAIR